MKLVAIKEYRDKELERLVKKGEEFDVTEERANVLIAAKVAKKAEPTTEGEPVTDADPTTDAEPTTEGVKVEDKPKRRAGGKKKEEA